MTLRLEITCDNAAFDPDPLLECARILRVAAERMDNGETVGRLFDVNGNCVGSYTLDPEDR